MFHQSAEAENCYGPFRTPDFTDTFSDEGFAWAGPDRLIYEGWFDTSRISPVAGAPARPADQRDLFLGLERLVATEPGEGSPPAAFALNTVAAVEVRQGEIRLSGVCSAILMEEADDG